MSPLLIAPIWNWNTLLFPVDGLAPILLIAPIWNWNQPRFFMNIKDNVTSNCTNMELKLGFYWITQRPELLLIAPIWNWNVIEFEFRYCHFPASNCTNMELKRDIEAFYGPPAFASNCTNMELKRMWGGFVAWGTWLLIAPIWNWNNFASVKATGLTDF